MKEGLPCLVSPSVCFELIKCNFKGGFVLIFFVIKIIIFLNLNLRKVEKT